MKGYDLEIDKALDEVALETKKVIEAGINMDLIFDMIYTKNSQDAELAIEILKPYSEKLALFHELRGNILAYSKILV